MAAAAASASLALKKLLSKSLVAPSSLGPIRATSTPSIPRRLFNTNAVRCYFDGDDLDDDVGDRFYRRDDLFSGGPSLFGPARSLSQVFELMDKSSQVPGGGRDYRRSWGGKETEDGLHLRVDLPGLGKEDVKVSVQHNTLVVEAEDGEEEDEEGRRRYINRVELPEKKFKMDAIKAEMKNGVLKLVLPKIKEEERANVFQVTVD